jgi:hypothetical protein
MGHDSRIELWSPNLTTFYIAGFRKDRLRREEAMKTAGKENPNRWTRLSSNRAPRGGGQNRSCSIQWAAKQEKLRPMQECFFLISTFLELIRKWPACDPVFHRQCLPNGLSSVWRYTSE